MKFVPFWSTTSLLLATTIATLLFPLNTASAADRQISITVLDKDNSPVKDAVVQLIAKNPVSSNGTKSSTQMTQKNKQFYPQVISIEQGASVTFSNFDDIQHHVYSFSKLKTFQLVISKDTLEPPITFDKPGAISIGCNIHDWMLAYIYVSETPYNAVTNIEGKAALMSVPDGDYSVEIWHARLPDTTKSYIKDGAAVINVTSNNKLTYTLTETIPTDGEDDSDIDDFEDY